MKRINIYVIVFIAAFVGGCKPVAYFNTPNDVFQKEAVVYMLDGTEKIGGITISFETGYDAGKFIELKNGNNDEKILIDNIRSYKIGEDYYYPKKILLDFNNAERLLFVKRLTKENSRIHLYELHQQGKQTSDGLDFVAYYISLPTQGRLEVWGMGSKNLFPNFEEKMSLVVKDCPTLSDKIRQKNKGYFLGQYTLSNSKKVEVLKRIIDEYNECH